MKKFFSKNKKAILGILFTALCLLVWRIGVRIPTPFLEVPKAAEGDSIFGFLDVFTGGALSQFSIVALGISPYITASIVIQLLSVAIPALERLAKQGEEGKKKITEITRYTTIAISLITALGYYFLLKYNGAFQTLEGSSFITVSSRA